MLAQLRKLRHRIFCFAGGGGSGSFQQRDGLVRTSDLHAKRVRRRAERVVRCLRSGALLLRKQRGRLCLAELALKQVRQLAQLVNLGGERGFGLRCSIELLRRCGKLGTCG